MKRLVNIVNAVDPRQIRKETNGRGDSVWVVPSYTLPDAVVMNGGLYSADEIAKSYHTLEGTLAPVGHPYNEDGDYISAFDGDAIDYFYAGAKNKNVRRVADEQYGHRVYLEVHINERVAMQTERGRAMLEALDNGDPVHTSTGVMVEVVESIGKNSRGEDYTWMATNMVFDHNCVLLDDEGAATPDDGVGMLVNHKLLQNVQHRGQTMAVNTVASPVMNESMRDKEARVRAAISDQMGDAGYNWLEDWGDDYAVIEADGETYRVGYSQDDDGKITISGDPEPVRKVTMWESVQNLAKRVFRGTATNSNQEEDTMFKQHIENVLKEAKVENVKNMTDEQKMAAYDEHMKANGKQTPAPAEPAEPEPTGQGETVVNSDVEKLVKDAVSEALKANAAQAEKAERDTLAEKLKANKADADLTRADQDSMTLNALRVLAKNSEPRHRSYGLPGQTAVNNDEFGETKMPNVEG